MKAILMLVVLLASMSLSAATNGQTGGKQATTNSVPVKSIKHAKQHRPQCEAITLSGNRCKRRAAVGSQYCSQHAAIMRKRSEAKEQPRGQASRKVRF